jgi:hypothetical protein
MSDEVFDRRFSDSIGLRMDGVDVWKPTSVWNFGGFGKVWSAED